MRRDERLAAVRGSLRAQLGAEAAASASASTAASAAAQQARSGLAEPPAKKGRLVYRARRRGRGGCVRHARCAASAEPISTWRTASCRVRRCGMHPAHTARVTRKRLSTESHTPIKQKAAPHASHCEPDPGGAPFCWARAASTEECAAVSKQKAQAKAAAHRRHAPRHRQQKTYAQPWLVLAEAHQEAASPSYRPHACCALPSASQAFLPRQRPTAAHSAQALAQARALLLAIATARWPRHPCGVSVSAESGNYGAS